MTRSKLVSTAGVRQNVKPRSITICVMRCSQDIRFLNHFHLSQRVDDVKGVVGRGSKLPIIGSRSFVGANLSLGGIRPELDTGPFLLTQSNPIQ